MIKQAFFYSFSNVLYGFLSAVVKIPFFRILRSHFSRLKSTFLKQKKVPFWIEKGTFFRPKVSFPVFDRGCQKVTFWRSRGLTFHDWKVPFFCNQKGTFLNQKRDLFPTEGISLIIFLVQKCTFFTKSDLFSRVKTMLHFF